MIRDGEMDEIEYCILNIETKHKEPINSIVYLKEAVATAAQDGLVKVYTLELNFAKKYKE